MHAPLPRRMRPPMSPRHAGGDPHGLRIRVFEIPSPDAPAAADNLPPHARSFVPAYGAEPYYPEQHEGDEEEEDEDGFPRRAAPSPPPVQVSEMSVEQLLSMQLHKTPRASLSLPPQHQQHTGRPRSASAAISPRGISRSASSSKLFDASEPASASGIRPELLARSPSPSPASASPSSAALAGSGPSARLWVQVSGVTSSNPATVRAVEAIGRRYRIHPVTIADVLEGSGKGRGGRGASSSGWSGGGGDGGGGRGVAREKMETFSEYVFLVLHAVVQPVASVYDIVYEESIRISGDERAKQQLLLRQQEQQRRLQRQRWQKFIPRTTYDRSRPNPFEMEGIETHSYSAAASSSAAAAARHPGSGPSDPAAASASGSGSSRSPRGGAASPPPSSSGAGCIFQAARVRTTPIHLVVFPHLVLSFHHDTADGSGTQAEVNAVCRKLHHLSETRMEGGQWIVHAIMDAIIGNLRPIVAEADREVDRLEEVIFQPATLEQQDSDEGKPGSDAPGALLKRLALTRRRLLVLQQQLQAKSGLIISLLERASSSASMPSGPYLRDLQDHVQAMSSTVSGASAMLESLQDAYLSQLQIKAERMSRTLNETMRTMSAFATILLPMSLISGIMGMNVEVPNQVWERSDDPDEDTLRPFWTIIMVMCCVGIVMAIFMRKRRLA